jgi:hypothetical protein
MKFKAVSCVGIMSEDSKLKQILEGLMKQTYRSITADISVFVPLYIGTDLGFVDTFLELQKETLCSSDDPCFTAYDESTDGKIDITSNVVFGRITPIARADRHITYSLPCSVSDPAGSSSEFKIDYLHVFAYVLYLCLICIYIFYVYFLLLILFVLSTLVHGIEDLFCALNTS